nr:immunoglobulin heavy chain junction region [Mus musculus]
CARNKGKRWYFDVW